MNNLKEIICYLLFNHYCFIKYNDKLIFVCKIKNIVFGNYYLVDKRTRCSLVRNIDIHNILYNSKLELTLAKVDRSLYILQSELNELRMKLDE